ncbi:ankyrin repeat domain-containing protein [Flavobacterium chuncheonense]|uniref:Ankyrin repeat domain-containing protein n=1 Tax=Flavobacterium chuncheonense TaxID=2026653 RepID=A0ABW5YR54_9FLAO
MRKLILFFLLSCFFGVAQNRDFFDVARNGSVAEAKIFFKQDNSVVNALNNHGFSPLILACYSSNLEIIDFLLENGADLNYVSQEGTALMAVTVKGNIQLVDLLLQKGANPNLTNANGITALMYAVQFNNSEIVKKLLDNGADKNILTDSGKSAFEYAVLANNEQIINLLK